MPNLVCLNQGIQDKMQVSQKFTDKPRMLVISNLPKQLLKRYTSSDQHLSLDAKLSGYLRYFITYDISLLRSRVNFGSHSMN